MPTSTPRATRPLVPAACTAALALTAVAAAALTGFLATEALGGDGELVTSVARVLAGLLAVLVLAQLAVAVRTARRGPTVPAAVVSVATGLVAASTGSDVLDGVVPSSLPLVTAAAGLVVGVAVLFLALDDRAPRSRTSRL